MSPGGRHPSLSPSALLDGYARGWFPMDEDGGTGPVGYFAAEPRGVIPVDAFHVPRSVARALRREPFEIRVNAAFAEVVSACAQGRTGVWLTPRLAAAYVELNAGGVAHSVEAWREGRLVGGLFGVALGGLFTGESMFHRESDAGSAALVATGRRLRDRGFVLWDIQMTSPHVERFGAVGVTHEAYLAMLERALGVRTSFAP